MQKQCDFTISGRSTTKPWGGLAAGMNLGVLLQTPCGFASSSKLGAPPPDPHFYTSPHLCIPLSPQVYLGAERQRGVWWRSPQWDFWRSPNQGMGAEPPASFLLRSGPGVRGRSPQQSCCTKCERKIREILERSAKSNPASNGRPSIRK